MCRTSCVLLLVLGAAGGQAPVADASDLAPFDGDWLVEEVGRKAGVFLSDEGRSLVMTNGIVSRTWRLAPNAACVSMRALRTGASLLRAVRPEARLVLDGEPIDVGGLIGQPNHAYLLPEWLEQMKSDPGAMPFVGYEVLKPRERCLWKRGRHHAPDAAWPPRGIALRLDFARDGVKVSVFYELYDGVPVFSKWLTVTNARERGIEIDRVTTEILAVVEPSNPVEHRAGVP